jgi:hypothetical protein
MLRTVQTIRYVLVLREGGSPPAIVMPLAEVLHTPLVYTAHAVSFL